MTPDPLPVALPELPTVAYEYESEDPYDSGELMLSHVKPERRNVSPLVRKSDAEAALRAQVEEVAALRADAERWWALQGIADSVRGWVAFKFDDTEETTYNAEQLATAIDAHLSQKEPPHV